MRLLAVIAALFFGVAIYGALFVPKGLPHRAEWELYRQANSTDSRHCPDGTFPYFLSNDDGTPIFLECVRGTSQ